MVVSFDDQAKTARLSLRQSEILQQLANDVAGPSHVPDGMYVSKCADNHTRSEVDGHQRCPASFSS